MTRPVALITGAGSGIGEAIARRLAPANDLLLTHLRHDDGLAAVTAQARGRGAHVEAVVGDLVEDALVHRAIAKERDGHLVVALEPLAPGGAGRQGDRPADDGVGA